MKVAGNRCQCVRHWHYTGAEQCASQCYYDEDEFCYLCQKYFDGLTTPSETIMNVDWSPGTKKESDYIESVTNVSGTRRVSFR